MNVTTKEYHQWLNQWLPSLPPWIRRLQTANEQERDDIIGELIHTGQFDPVAQARLGEADIARLKVESDLKIKRPSSPRVIPRPAKVTSDPALAENFRKLGFKIEWGWAAMEVRDDEQAHPIAEIAAQVGCNAKRLKKRLVRQGYTDDSLPLSSFFHLQELEADAKRQAACERQRKHRANLSPEAKTRIQQADRERKREQRTRARKPENFSVSEPAKTV